MIIDKRMYRKVITQLNYYLWMILILNRGNHYPLNQLVASFKKQVLLLVMVVGATVWVLTCPLSLVMVSTETTLPDLSVSVSYLMVEVNP
jgi:hypothetical protein